MVTTKWGMFEVQEIQYKLDIFRFSFNLNLPFWSVLSQGETSVTNILINKR